MEGGGAAVEVEVFPVEAEELALVESGTQGEFVQRMKPVAAGPVARVGTPPPAVPPFAVVPRRGVVERTLAWLGRCRRLSKDYEYPSLCSENAIYLAPAMLLVRRLARPAR